MQQANFCKNCGNEFTGRFCNVCGEKVYDEHDKSVKHLFEEVFHFITHFDTKFFTTLRCILFKPGLLSEEFCDGKRSKYYKPLSLFLICIILYLIFPLFRGLNMQLGTYTMPEYGYSSIAVPVIKEKMKHTSFSFEQVAMHYNETTPKIAKVLLLLFLPLSALTLQVLFYKRKKYFFDHFIMATEFNTFFVFVGFLVLPLIVYSCIALFPSTKSLFSDSGIFFKIFILLYLVVLSTSFKRFYKEKWSGVVFKSLIFLFVYNWVIKFIYNVILFFVVMLLIHK